MDVFDPVMQGGFAAFAVALVAILFWIIKKLFAMATNDLKHIKTDMTVIREKVEGLPCQDDDCPTERK